MQLSLDNIYNSDCLALMKEMKEQQLFVDCVVTSPPYNNSRSAHASEFSFNNRERRYDGCTDNLPNEDYAKWTCDIFNLFDKILKKNGVVLYNMSYGNENPDVMWLTLAEVIKNTPFQIIDCITWKKKSALPNNTSPNKLTRLCEYVYVFIRKSEYKTFYMNKAVKSYSRTGQAFYECYFNLIEAANNDEKCPYNNATYSSDLVVQLLNLYCPPNGSVYDPFMGSGTTAKGAILTNRHYIGSELSEKQVEWAKERLSNVVRPNTSGNPFQSVVPADALFVAPTVSARETSTQDVPIPPPVTSAVSSSTDLFPKF